MNLDGTANSKNSISTSSKSSHNKFCVEFCQTELCNKNLPSNLILNSGSSWVNVDWAYNLGRKLRNLVPSFSASGSSSSKSVEAYDGIVRSNQSSHQNKTSFYLACLKEAEYYFFSWIRLILIDVPTMIYNFLASICLAIYNLVPEITLAKNLFQATYQFLASFLLKIQWSLQQIFSYFPAISIPMPEFISNLHLLDNILSICSNFNQKWNEDNLFLNILISMVIIFSTGYFINRCPQVISVSLAKQSVKKFVGQISCKIKVYGVEILAGITESNCKFYSKFRLKFEELSKLCSQLVSLILNFIKEKLEFIVGLFKISTWVKKRKLAEASENQNLASDNLSDKVGTEPKVSQKVVDLAAGDQAGVIDHEK